MSNHTIDIVERFLSIFVTLYVVLILIGIVLSFVRLPYNRFTYRFREYVDDTVGPLLRAIRRFVPSLGPLDLSPMIATIGLIVLLQIANAILDSFRPA
jgi:YggT family protein